MNICTTPPKRVVEMFKQDPKNVIIARGVNKSVRDADLSYKFGVGLEFVTRGALFNPLLRAFRNHPTRLSSTLRRFVSGGCITRMDLAKFGYDVPIECKMCGSAGDSVFHRCFLVLGF